MKPYFQRILCIFIGLMGAFIVFAGIAPPAKTHSKEPQAIAFVWPISGSEMPDLPQSSPYGPRLKASEDFRYDYHQGIDIPTPISTTLVAVTTGTIRIAGSHPLYSDGVVQLDHGNGLYSNYIHITASLVVTGQVVGMGEPIALSGVSASGFPHLHFEIREGSVFRRDAVTPWHYLPYSDTISHTVAITEVLSTGAVWVQVTTPAHELDIQQITVTVRRQGDNHLLKHQVLDYKTRNKAYGGDPAVLDMPDLDGVLVRPHAFTTPSTLYVVDVQFHDVFALGPVHIEACALDVHSNHVCTTTSGVYGINLYLPLIRIP